MDTFRHNGVTLGESPLEQYLGWTSVESFCNISDGGRPEQRTGGSLLSEGAVGLDMNVVVVTELDQSLLLVVRVELCLEDVRDD